MARGNLPDDIVRLISFHGPVEVWTGRGERAATSKVSVAPFDDELILLVPPHSPLIAGLLQTCATVVTAKAADQSYSLRLEGRAVAGRPLTAHKNRASISPWLPEGVAPGGLLAVPFVAESVEMTRAEGHVRNRYAGPTPAGSSSPGLGRRWLATALGGGGRWSTIGALVGIFLWFGFLGADYPLRPLALVLGWTAALSLVAGTRLLGMSAAFGRWRRGQGRPDDIGSLLSGLVAPQQARTVGSWAMLCGCVALGGVALFPRGGQNILVILATTGLPLVAMAWILRVAVSADGAQAG